jgi:hypothetical protein
MYYLNTRILQFPAPNSPVTICSVQGYTFESEHLYSPAFDQAVAQQIDQLKHKFATRPNLQSQPDEIISSAHLKLLIQEMESGNIKQNSISLIKHPKDDGVIIQIHLK